MIGNSIESHGTPGYVTCSRQFREVLEKNWPGRFDFFDRVKFQQLGQEVEVFKFSDSQKDQLSGELMRSFDEQAAAGKDAGARKLVRSQSMANVIKKPWFPWAKKK